MKEDRRRAIARRFRRAWKLVALKGRCDEVGSAEYRRLRRMFESAAEGDVIGFIIAGANAPPHAQGAHVRPDRGNGNGVQQ